MTDRWQEADLGQASEAIQELAAASEGKAFLLLSKAEEADLILRYRKNIPRYFPSQGATIFYGEEGLRGPGSWAAYVEQCRTLFVQALGLAGVDESMPLNVMWDFATGPSVNVIASVLRDHIDSILGLGAANAYVVPDDVAWCIGFPTERYMGFGFADPNAAESWIPIGERRKKARRPPEKG